MKPSYKNIKPCFIFVWLIAIGLLNFAPCHAQDKCFSKGNFVINAGVGFSLYRYTAQLKSDNSSETNLAVSRIGRLSIEHAFKNYWSMGVLGKRNIYITEVDSATGKKPDIFSYDLLLFSNLHFVRTKHVDVLWGLGYGFSTFTYNTRDQQISQATGTGGSFETWLQSRFHFGKHLGFNLNLGYVRNNYNSLDFQNRTTSLPDALSLRGGGVHFGIGLLFKFFANKYNHSNTQE
jgi:hypothetical protein